MSFRGWRPPALVRDTGWTLLAQAGRLLSQALYFVIIARALGVNQFGALAATVALIAILTPFAALGAGNVLVMGVARDRSSFPVLFGNALLSVLLTAWVLVPLTLVIAWLVLPGIPWQAVLLLSLAEYVLGRAADVGAMAFQAVDRLDLTALLGTIAPALRAVAAVLFVTLPVRHDIEAWSVLYVLASALGAVAAVTIVLRRLGRARMSPRLLRRHVRLGAYFAVSASATTIYGDIDKTMLGRLATFEATGIYAAA
ncbi:MAG TPA: oligosaccharide flippase family protein, partial [Gaiellales bacterium]